MGIARRDSPFALLSHGLFLPETRSYTGAMIFWVLAGFLAAAAALALAVTGRRAMPPAAAKGASLAIYRDQLAEIGRDLEQGALKPGEAESQKAEVGRRMLLASREEEAVVRQGRSVPAAIVLLVPLLAFALYALRGTQLPDVPRAERIAMAQATGDVEGLVVQVEEHLRKQPGDVTGWKLLVPTYISLARYNDAAAALSQILTLEKPTAERFAELAETLTFANQGLMTEAAQNAAAEALKLDASQPKARYYDALAAAQRGNRDDAIAKFKALLAAAPATAPWRSAVESQISSLTAMAPALTDDQLQAALSNPEEQAGMIRAMVDGLEARLAGNGNDAEGWRRLIRARAVLNEPEKAREALAKARAATASDHAAMVAFDNLARELNLQ